MKMIRQGDVLLVAIEKQIPMGLVSKSEVILAEGELTGHAHRLTGTEVYEWAIDGQRYVQVKGGSGSLSHEDHDPVPVAVVAPDTTYRIVPQQEWNLADQWQKVRD